MPTTSVTQQELVERCRLLSDDQKHFITARAKFMRLLISEFELMRQAPGFNLPNNEISQQQFFGMMLIDFLDTYCGFFEASKDPERAAFMAVEKIRRDMILGMTQKEMPSKPMSVVAEMNQKETQTDTTPVQ